MELTFKIVRKKYIYASCYCADDRLEMSVGLTLTDGKETKNVTQKKARIKYLVDTYIGQCEKADTPVLKRDLERIILDDINKVRKVRSSLVQDLFTKYYEMMRAGEILNDGKRYSDSQLDQYRSIKNHLIKSGFGAIQIEQFSIEDFEGFKAVLLKGRSKNTLSGYTTHLLTFFKRSYKMKWHKNPIYLQAEDLRVSPEDIDTHVYLSIEEIEKIRKLDFNNRQSRQQRDLFVFGCYTGLRFSDLTEVGGAAMSGDIIEITLRKGGNKVYVPMGRVVRELWEQYKGKMPTRKDSNNSSRRIREFCEKAGINEPTLYTNTIGGKKISKLYPKHELVGTHTMRRSFATNAFKAGVPAVSIMKITGHKTETSFMKYIRISGEENAELMKQHKFFS